MRSLLYALAFAFLLLPVPGLTQETDLLGEDPDLLKLAPDLPPPKGSTPPSSISRWIKFFVLGPRNYPFPIVWLSPYQFDASTPYEYLTTMPAEKYYLIEAYTKRRLSLSDCSKKPKRVDWYTLEISQHIKGSTQVCVLPQKRACRYFKGLLQLPAVGWTPEELGPLQNFVRAIKCEASK